MIIKLSPSRRDDTLEAVKTGAVLTLNGEDFDLSPMSAGDTLPATAVTSWWFAADVDNVGGELIVTLLLPLPWNYSYEQAFPVDLVEVPDGPVMFPQPLPENHPSGETEVQV